MPCGKGTVTNSQPKCDNCIWAPDLEWFCSDGAVINGLFEINILEESNYTPPEDGSWKFELLGFDGTGIENVTLSEGGDLSVRMNGVYIKDRKYPVRYRIYDQNGIRRATGTVSVCTASSCASCTGECDQENGLCLVADDISRESVSCGSPIVLDLKSQGEDHTRISYSVFGEDVVFDGASISSEGILTIPLSNGIQDFSRFYRLSYRKKSGRAFVDGKVKISFYDECTGVVLAPGQSCNSCTGQVTQDPIDIQITDSGSDLTIQQ